MYDSFLQLTDGAGTATNTIYVEQASPMGRRRRSLSYYGGQIPNEHIFMRHLLSLQETREPSKKSDSDTEHAQSKDIPTADLTKISAVTGLALLVVVAMVIGLTVWTFKKRFYGTSQTLA